MTAEPLPNTFIVGAPKCGTSSLASWLGNHPHVFMSMPKEPHFWSTDVQTARMSSRKQYLRIFKGSGPFSIKVEASTWYLHSQVAVPAIETSLAGSRYIVCVRDPVEMAYSLFLHHRRNLSEDQVDFQKAWNLQDQRRSGSGLPRGCRDYKALMYSDVCKLGMQLRRLLDVVTSERVLVVELEKLRQQPLKEYQRVLRFLGLPPDGKTDFPARNRARQVRSVALQRLLLLAGSAVKRKLGIRRQFGLLSLNERELSSAESITTVSSSFLDQLKDHFATDRQLLRALIGQTSLIE